MEKKDHYSKYVSDPNLIGRYSSYQDKYKSEPRESDKAAIDLVRTALGVKPNPRVLDVACSTGNFLRHLHQRLPDASLVGVDLAAALIEKCAADPDLAAIEFRVANIIDLSELGSFDAITCNAVTYLLDWDDYSRALKSIYAALRPGGRYVGFELANPFSVQDLTIVETSEWNPAGLVLRVRPIARVEKAFHEAGFASVDFHEFTMPIDLPFPGYDADVVTYTRKDESGKRLSFRGAFFQPWYHIVATKPA